MTRNDKTLLTITAVFCTVVLCAIAFVAALILRADSNDGQKWRLELDRNGQYYYLDYNLTIDDCASEAVPLAHKEPSADVYCQPYN